MNQLIKRTDSGDKSPRAKISTIIGNLETEKSKQEKLKQKWLNILSCWWMRYKESIQGLFVYPSLADQLRLKSRLIKTVKASKF